MSRSKLVLRQHMAAQRALPEKMASIKTRWHNIRQTGSARAGAP